MMKYLLSIAFLIALAMNLQAQSLTKIDKRGLEKLVNRGGDTVYVINFWATWCKPCVAELPSFDSLATGFQNRPVRVVLVSNDFEDEIDTKLKPFLARKRLKPEVMVLTETNANVWLPIVDKDWSGAIPVTLLYQGKSKRRIFIGTETRFAELKMETEKLLRK